MNLPTISVNNVPIVTNIAERVATSDDRDRVYGFGFTVERPNDKRGDSVNQLMLGLRSDILSEFLADRRAKSDRDAVASENLEVTESQVVNDVPITDPIVQLAS